MALGKAVISIVGSLNVDLVTRTSRVPAGGETLTATSFDTGFGGKGANQAVACARLSRRANGTATKGSSDVDVRMVGAVGDDHFGRDFLSSLTADGLDVSKVRVIEKQKTGTATILVEEQSGENRIMVVPGANNDLPVATLFDEDTSVALFQLEIPMNVVLANIRAAKDKGIDVVINPAPAVPLPDEIFQGLGHLIVNETEAAILSNRRPEEVSADSDLSGISSFFIKKGVRNVIVTLGSHGVYYQTAERELQGLPGGRVHARKVQVVDTTAAGDTFVGAYSVAVARSKHQATALDLDEAIGFANRAAAQTVQKEGAQKSIPWVDEVPEA